MRYMVATLSGFVLTLVVFAGGGLTAIFFVNAKPVPVAHPLDGDTGALWTSKAVAVSAEARDLQRIPARQAPQTLNPVPQKIAEAKQPPDRSAPSDPTAPNPTPATDQTTTAATSPDGPEPRTAPALSAAHVEWCSRHYRSYDPADNSYNSYSGARRECVSPYSDGASNADSPVASDQTESVNASTQGSAALVTAATEEMSGGYLSPEHVQSCFDRYRSYRPEDNSYQPYGGGPRQQCD